MLDFRVRTLIEVCRYMNFTRAAESLNITQPTVSQHIRWLEEQYNTMIFTFSGKKMSLTESGRQILNMAVTMAHDEQFLKKQIEEQGRGKQEIRFGATLSIGESVVGDWVARRLSEHPEDHISVTVANTKRLAQMLNDGAIDFALVEGYFEKKEFDYQLLSREAYVCVCAPSVYQRITKKKNHVSMKALMGELLLIREPGSGTREILEKNLRENNYGLEDFFHMAEINNISSIKKAVRRGCGITFLYQRAAEEEIERGTLQILPVEGFPLFHEWVAIWRKGSAFAPLYQDFLEQFRGKRTDV